MIIRQKSWELGALTGADPSSHSFHSHNWHRSGGKRQAQEDQDDTNDNVVSIGSHPPCRDLFLSVNVNLGNAISFSQTQDAFLRKVQNSLERMNELSSLAQNESQPETERKIHCREFADLQNRIRDIEDKMVDAINLFKSAALELSTDVGEMIETEEMATFGRIPIHDYLDSSADPAKTVIVDGKTATDASGTIKDALGAISRLRTKVGDHILELSQAGELLAEEIAKQQHAPVGLQDGSLAEENTKCVRTNILAKSRVAMLAQANALPQATLRLLG